MSLTRVARREWGQSTGPLACETPRAILSRRLDGGIGPLKGVTRWAGRASRVWKGVNDEDKKVKDGILALESNRTCSAFHSYSESSGPFELFQLSVLFLLGCGGTKMDGQGDPQLRGVLGEAAEAKERSEGVRRGTGGRGRTRATGEAACACIDKEKDRKKVAVD